MGFHPAMLPAILPLFPLPRVVLFPRTFLPLHIFEPRYRQMTAECLASHKHFILLLTRAHEGPDVLPEATRRAGPDLSSPSNSWWLEADSNRRPRDYETLALTT